MKALLRLADVPADRLHRHAAGLGFLPHPDAALLELCAKLREQQRQWQVLWHACPEVERGGKEDRALDRYSAHVWPATQASKRKDRLIPQLLKLRATTVEGVQAKAAAIIAMEDTYKYLDIDLCGREDELQLQLSTLREAAGPALVPVGMDAP